MEKEESSSQPKFILDAMYGRLARWLRLLGYDTLYNVALSDNEILKIARNQSRILITNDQKLFRRAQKSGVKAISPPSKSIMEMLTFLHKTLKLNIKLGRHRCPKCNTLLRKVTRMEARDLVPLSTLKAYDTFWVCRKCNKAYWKGRMWKNITRILEQVG